jgi:hypothetical protein
LNSFCRIRNARFRKPRRGFIVRPWQNIEENREDVTATLDEGRFPPDNEREIIMDVNFSRESDRERFETVRRRADELGVKDINFSLPQGGDALESYEQTLDLIEKHKAFFDMHMGEA